MSGRHELFSWGGTLPSAADEIPTKNLRATIITRTFSGSARYELCHRAMDRRSFYLHQHGAPVLGRRRQTRQPCRHPATARRIRPRPPASIQTLGAGHVPGRDGIGRDSAARLPAGRAVFLAGVPWGVAMGDQCDSRGDVRQGDWGFGVSGVFQEGGWVEVCTAGYVFLFAVVFGVGGGVVGGGVGVRWG